MLGAQLPAEEMPESSYIQIRVSKQRKQRWKRAADDDPEWRSLTHLMVTSVEHQLMDNESDEAVGEVELDRVHERFETLANKLDTVEDRLDETYFLVRDDGSNYTEITARIHDLIPEVSDRESILSTSPNKDDDLKEIIRKTGSTSHLVKLLQGEGYKPLNIKEAIERLDRDSATVEATYARPQEEKDKRVYRIAE
ncbi:hypothetical protein JCM17823_24060 [Halorubrum gandharaense]